MKNKIIFLVVGILVVIAIYTFSKGGVLTNSIVVNEDGSIEGEYSVMDIMTLNRPYECTFNKTDGASHISGAIKTAEGKVRADLDIELRAEDGGNFASHFIMRDDMTYVWTSLQAVGYKAEIADSADKNASPIEQAQIVGLKDKIAYKCSPWNATLNLFDLPSGITFLDLK
jgi:hypothetical protein